MRRAIVFMACGVFVLISLSACTSALLKEAHPDYFSQIIKKSGECADISGKYEFSTPHLTEALDIEGCWYTTLPSAISLEVGDIVPSAHDEEACIFSTIEIHSDENSLEFVVNFDDKEVRKSLSEESGDYQCYGDGIILYEKNNIYFDLLGPSKELTIVYPAVDGALFLWHGKWASGLVLFAPLPPIPMVSQEGVWHRHEPVD